MAVDDDREDKELFRRGIGFLHRARPLCGLPPGAFARVERRLQQPVSKPRRRPLLLAAATLGLLLVAGTAFAVVNGGLARLPLLGPWLAPSPTVLTPRAPKPRHARPSAQPPAPAAAPSSPAEPVTPPAESATTVAAVSAPPPAPPLAPTGSAGAGASAAPPAVLPRPSGNGGTPVPAVAAKPAAPVVRKVALASPPPSPAAAGPAPASAKPTPAPAAVPSAEPILDESRSLSAAIERWHRDRAASAALGALDEHDRRFADGHLRLESRLLRAEILLAQGREREGLALLDQVPLSGSPRARELFTVRGELRIKLGRCPEGRADLDEVLAKGMADAFARRATAALRHCP